MPFAARPRGADGLGQQGTGPGPGKALTIVFSALHFASFRNFESAVLELAHRGHRVHLMADEPESLGGEQLVRRLAAESPGITWGSAAAVVEEPWYPAARKLRHALEFVRFVDPRFDDSPKLRLRTAERAPRVVRWLGLPGVRRTPLRRWTAALLRQIEYLLPPSERDVERLRALRPDVLLLASLTFPRAPQLDHQKAARRLGIPVGACIMSWDHLSSKAPLHLVPDRVFVWNDVQRREAMEMHPIPGDRIVVTGAQCYDHWFGRQPSRSRDAFCRAFGFDPERRLLFYVASAMSPGPSPSEPEVVRSWLEAMRRASDASVREASVLIRPHPERVKEWRDFDPSALGPVVVCAGNPLDPESRTEYFDALALSDAVVGVCTTAFLEAAIAGRPVFALRHPAFRMHQDAMVHFRYLVEVEGGILQRAETMEGHLAQLAGAFRDPPGQRHAHERFLRAFIRPEGLDAPATPRFADAVEGLARSRQPPEAVPDYWGRPLLQPIVRHLLRGEPVGVTRWLLMDAVDVRRERSERTRREVKEHAKRVRARNPKKQLARLKTRVKQWLGRPIPGA